MTKKTPAGKTPEMFVKKHNSLIQLNHYLSNPNSGEPLTILELQLMLYAISKLDQDEAELQPVLVSVADFFSKRGQKFSSGSQKAIVMDALTRLMQKIGWVESIDPATGVRVYRDARWVLHATYTDDYSPTIQIEFDPQIAPGLLQLRANYSTLYLPDLYSLTRSSAFVLYELLSAKSHEAGPYVFTLDELKDSFGCRYTSEKSASPSYFIRRNLEPAIKEINTQCELLKITDWKQLKNGRTTYAIEFHTEQPIPVEEHPEVAFDPEVLAQISFDEISELNPEASTVVAKILTEMYTSNQKTFCLDEMIDREMVLKALRRITGNDVLAYSAEITRAYNPKVKANKEVRIILYHIGVEKAAEYRETTLRKIMEQTQSEQLMAEFPASLVKQTYEVIADHICYTDPNGSYDAGEIVYPQSQVQERLRQVTYAEMRELFRAVENHQESVRNYRRYVVVSLLNGFSVPVSNGDRHSGERELDANEIAAIERMMRESE